MINEVNDIIDFVTATAAQALHFGQMFQTVGKFFKQAGNDV